MSSARARKMKETNQVIRLIKDLDKRMESFEESVEELKILKDSLGAMNDQVAEQEISNVEALKRLREDLKENRMKALTETAESLGKVVVSEGDLVEIKAEVQKWKDECAKVKLSVQKEIKESVDEQVGRQIKILELQHENKTSKLTATCESYQSEIINLKETIARMSQELESQKKLTADVARVRSGQSFDQKQG